MITSALIVIWYLCKVCKMPKHIQLTSDQRSLVWISIATVFFNDPTYLASIFKPSLFTSVISQFWLAWFFALLMQYWLRSVERVKDQEAEAEMIQRLRERPEAEGIRMRSPIEIGKNIYFLILVLDVLGLYTVY